MARNIKLCSRGAAEIPDGATPCQTRHGRRQPCRVPTEQLRPNQLVTRRDDNMTVKYKQVSYGIERMAKGTASMGVNSCRSREASLIPKYSIYQVRVKATTERHDNNLGNKRRRQLCPRGWRKLPGCTERGVIPLNVVIDPTTA